jgi:hypothetical protein
MTDRATPGAMALVHLALVISGCRAESTDLDSSGGGVDASRADAVDLDATPHDVDAHVPLPDAQALPDATCATVSDPTHYAGNCDNMGRIECAGWATGVVDGGIAYSLCANVAGMGAICVRADRCTGMDETSCSCGSAAPCVVGTYCGGSPTECRCIQYQ